MSKISNSGETESDIFNDFSLASMNNVVIGQYSAKGIKGVQNVIIGKNAGKIAYEVNNSIFIGNEAGSTILTGNRNISIGNDKIELLEINSTFNLGYNKIFKDKSINIGSNIINNNYDLILNNQLLINNSNNEINLLNYSFGNIVNLGINNNLNSNINIGNYNSNINISIGSSNISINSNAIIIGNNIENYKYSLNIDNIICKFNSNLNSVIYLGIGFYNDIPIIIGSKNDLYFNLNENLFIKDGLSTNIIKFNNDNEGSIYLKLNDNQNGNIIYYLPSLPDKYDNIFLTTDINGNLKWIEITDVLILTIITHGDTICNDFISSNIYGKGAFITNININDKTTDDLNNGIKNLYLSIGFISSYFLDLISTISTNIIKDSEKNSNFYFNENRYFKNFTNNLNLITTDYIKSDQKKFYTSNDYYIYPKLIFKNLTTDNLKSEDSNLYFNEQNFNKYSLNIFNLIKEGTSNFFLTNERLLRNFNNYLNYYNTNQIYEGSNKFYNDILTSNIIYNNFLSNITTDLFKEGSNLYSGDERIIRFFNSKIITTNDINTSNNLNYFNSNSNYILNTDFIKEKSNRYINNRDILNTITFNTNTDFYKTGNSNIYGTEKIIISDFSKITSNEYTTDNINEINKNNRFIKNNFYNNDILINGFLKGSNINNLNFETLREIVDEIKIGPQTEVINTYDINSFNINSRLSNIEITYINDNNDKIPFIVINNKVGVHNLNPKYELDVNGIINCCNLLFNEYNFSNIMTSIIKYDINSNVGIGTTTPVEKLQVIGNILASGTILSSFSDIRLKNIIEPLNNSLEIINNLNGFKYKPNEIAKSFGFDDNIEIGLNAQEVKKFIPEIVSLAPFDINKKDNKIISKSGEDYLSLRYERLIPYLIEGIKELKKENDELKKNQKIIMNLLNI